jgi:hypothetical protein
MGHGSSTSLSHDMPGSRGVIRRFLIYLGVLALLQGAGLAGCSTAEPTLPPLEIQPGVATFSPDGAPRHKTPTATAQPFELRSSSTPLPSPTAISLDDIGAASTFAPGVNPLTGLTVADPELLNRRPMVIKITNFPRSVRPQWGLTAADHVYEYYLEQQLTRFIGIFYGQDASRVGPVRSARPFDEYIFRMYKGIFTFGYADDRVIDLWKDSDVKSLLVIENPDNCPPMCRIGPSNAYNTLFTDTAALSKYVSKRGIDNGRQHLEGLHFEKDNFLLRGGGQADRIDIQYSPTSYNYWRYDPQAKHYLRWQESPDSPDGYQPLIDHLNYQQISADNLVILLPEAENFYKSNSTEIYNFKLIDKGKGYALRDGKIYAIEWYRPLSDSMISIYFDGGGAFPLKPGNIWFEVLDTLTTSSNEGSNWRFEFKLP